MEGRFPFHASGCARMDPSADIPCSFHMRACNRSSRRGGPKERYGELEGAGTFSRGELGQKGMGAMRRRRGLIFSPDGRYRHY